MNTAAFSPLLGLDLDTTTGDLQFTVNGDIALVSGQALLYQRFFDELVGSNVLFAPTFGANVGQYLDTPFDTTQQAAITQRVISTLQLDPAVSSVGTVTLTMTGPTEMTIAVNINLVSSLASLVFNFPISTV